MMQTNGITNLTYHQGQTMRYFTAVYHADNGRTNNLFFDCDTKQLVINKWYDLPQDEIDTLKPLAIKAFISATADLILKNNVRRE